MEQLYVSEFRLFFVMPFVEGGDLYSLFKVHRRFSEQLVKFYAAQITLALGYLHDKGIIHRDLKLENILVNKCGYLRIIDFGLSKYVDTPESLSRTYCGTTEYLAPEMVQKTGHSFGVDWWALGILIYEMVIGITPFFTKNKSTLFSRI